MSGASCEVLEPRATGAGGRAGRRDERRWLGEQEEEEEEEDDGEE